MSLRATIPIRRVAGRSKRAPRACESCRVRKVRCDVIRTKPPCTNCRLDGKECVLPASKRRHVGDRVLGLSELHPQSPICDAIIDFADVNGNASKQHGYESVEIGPHEVCFDAFELSGGAVALSATSSLVDCRGKDSVLPDLQRSFLTPYPSPTKSTLDEIPVLPTLPDYIKPLPKSLAAEDLEYLNIKSAFDIPEPQIRNQLLTAYAQWVHPFGPMLDLEDVLSAIFSNGETGKISLLLLQSMFLAASAYVKLKDGSVDQRKRRATLYTRTRLLHDFKVDPDQLTICHAAILLSHWDGESEAGRDSYYWLGIASMHATSIGLNLDFMNNQCLARQRRASKLTWWTLLVRDRLLAVALRRPVQNKVARLEVPMLQTDDFEAGRLLKVLKTTLKVGAMSLEVLETLFGSFIALTQLSEYVDKVLVVQYTVQRPSPVSGRSAGAVSLVPTVVGSRLGETLACGEELQTWYGYLPEEVHIDSTYTDCTKVHESEVVRVHRALLAAYYSMTLMTLYRPLLSVQATSKEKSRLRRSSMKMVSQAANRITCIFTNLYVQGLISRLPDTAIAALEPAVATHLLCSKSENPAVQDADSPKFYLCWQILQEFKEVYPSVENTIAMVGAAAQRLKALYAFTGAKNAAHLHFSDGLWAMEEQFVRAPITVPIGTVVADHEIDQSVVTPDWSTKENEEDLEGPKQVFDHYSDGCDLDSGCASDANAFAFGELISWDGMEGIET